MSKEMFEVLKQEVRDAGLLERVPVRGSVRDDSHHHKYGTYLLCRVSLELDRYGLSIQKYPFGAFYESCLYPRSFRFS